MAKIYVKPYADYTISGNDFAMVRSDAMRRIVFSPDRKNAISITELRDGCLMINNENQVPFEFSISRLPKIIAVVKYNGNDSLLNINTNWRLKESGVENREIHTNPDLIRSPHINIDVRCNGIGRIDLKIDESGYAACVFSRELLFVRMNGNHSVPRLLGFIENEKEQIKREHVAELPAIGKAFFQKWFFESFLPNNTNN